MLYNQTMLIGIDGNEANVEKKVGIGEYAFELIKQFYELRMTNDELCFVIYLKEPPREEMPKGDERWQYKVIGPKKMWTQLALPLHLFIGNPRPDVFFTPSHYAPRFALMPTAISIMDLSYIHFPKLFNKHDLYQLTNWTKYSARQARHIFTISNASKDDIIKEYHVAPNDVTVTYLGIREEAKGKTMSQHELIQKYGICKNYILFVGTLQPRKNITRLIEAFSYLEGPVRGFPSADARLAPSANKLRVSGSLSTSATPKDLELVIVGKKGWLYEDILAAPEKYGVMDSVKFLDFVPTEDLPSLYEHALCYVLPSLYEGFGLPVLEAMKYGCPVITSNVSSLPEAGGDAAIYVDPKNVEDIAQKMQQVISDEKLRGQMSKKGLEHIKKFSWEKAAKETLGVLQSLGKK